MNIERMKYHFSKITNNKTWEDFQAAMIEPDDDLETIYKKISSIMCCYSLSDRNAWECFKDIYYDIPIEHRMYCLFEIAYTNFYVDYIEVLWMIKEYLEDETQEIEELRINKCKKLLKEYVPDFNNITIWRGTAEGSIFPKHAISWSLKKEVADSFVKYHKTRHGSRFGVVTSDNVSIKDILYFSDDREEMEVFVLPYFLRDKDNLWVPDEIERLDEMTFEDYFSETEEYEAWAESEDEHDDIKENVQLTLTPDKLQKITKIARESVSIDDSEEFTKKCNELIAMYEAGN